MKPTLGLLTLVLAGSLTLASCGGNADGTSNTQTSSSDDATQPPWPAPTDVAQRATAAGLDLGPMGMAAHFHPTLHVIINGQQVPVPPNIGVDTTTGAMASLHTHEADGMIHIEADRADEVFTLGQFFTEWGVPLTRSRVGGVRASQPAGVVVTSDGRRVAGDPRELQLAPDQQIVVSVK